MPNFRVTISASSQDATDQSTITFVPIPRTISRSTNRRATGYATLDGGNVIVDLGYSYADAIPSFAINDPSRDIIAAIDYLQANYSIVTLSSVDGCFSAAIKRAILSGGIYTITMTLKQRLDVDN